MRLIKSNKYNRQVNDSLKASIRASVSIDILIEIIFKEIITDEWAVRNLTNESSDLNLHGLIFDLSLKHSQIKLVIIVEIGSICEQIGHILQ